MTVLVVPAAYCLNFRMLTGHWYPLTQIDKLETPAAVEGWTPKGLDLADGRQVILPGVVALPANSPVLAEAVRQGVEISPEGQVYGLVKVHHWCGNDPVRKHLAKVNLAEMLLFAGDASPEVPFRGDSEALRSVRPNRFTQHGWNMSDYNRFQIWQSIRRWEH